MQELKECLHIAKALADKNRLRIIMFLREGELCVCKIIQMLELAPSTVSKHMSVLHQAGLVESRKDSRWIYYRLIAEDGTKNARQAIAWVRNSLEKDSQIISDTQKLEVVNRLENGKLCQVYDSSLKKEEKYLSMNARP